MVGPTPITDTGTRGFLVWVRREFPPALYRQIAAQVAQRVPQAFSGYMLGEWKRVAQFRGFADTAATVDTADAASTTPMQSTWADQISEIIGTIAGAYQGTQAQQAQQAQTNNIINTQLALAQQGKTPANVSLSANGITFGTQSMSVGNIVLLGLGIFAAGKLLKVF